VHGQIMIENERGVPWIYVPAANIQFRADKTGEGKLIISAFRTDGYRIIGVGLMPMAQWLQENHHFTSGLDVPDEIVHYAVESERKCQEMVEAISGALKSATTEGGTSTAFAEFAAFISALDRDALDQARQAEEELEHKYALTIQKLLTHTEGPQ